jgi:hypothetical protein
MGEALEKNGRPEMGVRRPEQRGMAAVAAVAAVEDKEGWRR